MKNLEFKYKINKSGLVKEAWTYDKGTGKKSRFKIASNPNQFGFIKRPKNLTLKNPEVITTSAGTYEVNQVVVYESTYRSFMGTKIEMTSVHFVHPDAKLGIVKQTFSEKSEVPLLDVLNFIANVGPYTTVYKTLLKFILGKASEGMKRKTISPVMTW